MYHEINYMDSYLDSMEYKVGGESPSFIRHSTNRSYEIQIELLKDQRFVFIYYIHGKQVGKWYLQDMVVGDILHDKPISLDDFVY